MCADKSKTIICICMVMLRQAFAVRTKAMGAPERMPQLMHAGELGHSESNCPYTRVQMAMELPCCIVTLGAA